MKLSIKLCYTLAFLIFLFSCNKGPTKLASQSAIVFPDSTADVYIAGYETDSSQSPDRVKAIYWKNGIPVELTDGTIHSEAYSIAVSGTDIYVAGLQLVNGNHIATYWKNGVLIALPSNHFSRANSIAVSGNDVHICGFDLSNNRQVASYWKNGIQTILSDGSKNVVANAIYLDGADVYICGAEDGQTQKAILWKNGNRVPIIDSMQSVCSSIAVNNNAVYIAGYGFEQNNGFIYNYHPKFWQNGNSQMLAPLPGEANMIIVSENDVYIAGLNKEVDGADTIWRAKYWKNGLAFNLESPITSFASANGIAIFNNYNYVVGNIDGNGALWINGSLFTTIGESVRLSDVKVVAK